MNSISKNILIDELIENSHIEKVEDVIFWALEAYSKGRNTSGSCIAYAIVNRIVEAEKQGVEELQNPETISKIFNK